MSGLRNWVVATASGSSPSLPRRSWPISGLFLAGCPFRAGRLGREPGSLATHRAGRAYYSYVASHDAKQGILAGNP
jgi:hypothetical protein